jgi:hypothetical protein
MMDSRPDHYVLAEALQYRVKTDIEFMRPDACLKHIGYQA